MGCLKADIWANMTIFFKDLRGRELGSSKLRGSKLTIQPIRLEAIKCLGHTSNTVKNGPFPASFSLFLSFQFS